MQSPSKRRVGGAFLAQLMVIAVAALIPAFATVATAPSASAGGVELPSLPPGSSTTVRAARSSTSGATTTRPPSASTRAAPPSNNVTQADEPEPDREPAARLVLGHHLAGRRADQERPGQLDPPRGVVRDPEGRKICGMGNPAGEPKTDIEIVKTASKVTVTPGEEITYTLKVRNVGNTTAHNVLASDVLPDGATFVSASAGCTYDGATRKVTCDAGTMPVASTRRRPAAAPARAPTTSGSTTTPRPSASTRVARLEQQRHQGDQPEPGRDAAARLVLGHHLAGRACRPRATWAPRPVG